MNSLTRESRRDQIVRFFSAHIGECFATADMHARFGSAFRSRVSEVNRNSASPIIIYNHVERLADGAESSCYWAELKNSQPTIAWAPTSTSQGCLFDDLARQTARHLDLN